MVAHHLRLSECLISRCTMAWKMAGESLMRDQ